MPTLRQRLANALLGDERKQLINAIQSLAEVRHFRLTGGEETSLSEVDPQLIDLLIQQAGFTRIGGPSQYGSLDQVFTEGQRQRVVMDSRWMYHFDVMVSAAIDMWTDFGFGQNVSVAPTDPTLAEAFSEFWNARRNQPVLGDAKIHENSQRVLTDGEIFFAIWVSTLDGEVTIRRLTTDRIARVITDPDDPDTPLWYVERTQAGEVYYPDWRASESRLDSERKGLDNLPLIPANARKGSDLRPETAVVILPVQRNVIGQRGWPQMRQALAWARAYRDFVGDRATVAKKAALRVETLTVKNAGQRQIDSIVGQMQSSLVTDGNAADRNQNLTAGQTFVQNENASLAWMNRDTGASAAQIDGLSIAAQFSAGARVPLHWLGRADAMQNRAVAKESALPWYEQIQRYQTMWVAVFQDVAEIVGRFTNEYGNRPAIDDFTVEVGMDSPFQNDIDEVTAVMDSVASAASASLIDSVMAANSAKALTVLALQSLGIRNTTVITGDGEQVQPSDDDGLEAEALAARERWQAVGSVGPYALDAYLTESKREVGEFAEGYIVDLRLTESVNEVLREYTDVLTRLGFDVLNGRMDKVDYRRAHKEALGDFGKRAYQEALREGGADPDDTTLADAERLLAWTDEQKQFVNGYAGWLVTEDEDGKRNTEAKRTEMGTRIDDWAGSLRNLAQIAEAAAEGDPSLKFDGEDGDESCDECQEFSGVVHRLSYWEKRGLLKRNGNSEFGCGRFKHCHHHYYSTKTGDMVIA